MTSTANRGSRKGYTATSKRRSTAKPSAPEVNEKPDSTTTSRPELNGPTAEVLKNLPPQSLRIEGRKDESEHNAIARGMTRPEVSNGLTAQRYSRVDGAALDVAALVNVLEEQVNAVNSGDMRGQEATLVSQSPVLDLIFNDLGRRAAINFKERYLGAGETYMRLALKAQSQCRTTIETLTEIKNPRPIAFVKQANIAAGHQHVNNAPAQHRAREIQSTPNKLLETTRGEWLDTRAQGATGGANQELAAVGEVDRTTHC